MRSMLLCGLLAIAVLGSASTHGSMPPAGAARSLHAPDLILHHAKVWTVDAAQPLAEAVAVAGDRIVKVGSSRDVLLLRSGKTQVIDLNGRLLLPGFTDAHTHLENAADWVFQVSLFDVNTEDELMVRLREAAARVPKGMWITGGDLGAYAAWNRERKGEAPATPLTPTLKAVDAAVPDHPVLVRRYDMAYFANSVALARARFTANNPDPRGGRMGRDEVTGALNGMLYGRAGERLAQLIPPPSLERKLVGARVALADLNRLGITAIHDIARYEPISQKQIFHTAVERSFTNLEIFLELRRRGQLTVRVYPSLTLSTWREVLAAGFKPGGGDDWIRYGMLKAFVDGYLMQEPYADTPRFAGDFTFRFVDEATIQRDVVDADAAGFDSGIHVGGDRAIHLMLDWYETAYRTNPPRDRRFRMIHVLYPTAADIQRAGRLKLIADITPYHMIKDLGSVERKLGPERARTAHAWRAMLNAGVRLNVVSDWPGSYNEQEYTPINPLENIYFAVTRQTLDGRPAGGWHPNDRLTVEEAIQGYTINPAYSSYEERLKGSISEGKLADLVVLSKDILSLPPSEIPKVQVDYTILGGRIIYQR